MAIETNGKEKYLSAFTFIFRAIKILYQSTAHNFPTAVVAEHFMAEVSLVSFFFFFNRHYNLSWVSACSTVVEHSQQEGFTDRRCQRQVKPPTWRTRDLERSNFRHKRPQRLKRR
jgi:hypothetical protein